MPFLCPSKFALQKKIGDGGELVVIAFCPSFGKTSFALSLLKTIIIDQKIGIGSRKKHEN
jgi:hypothetical protein